MNDFVIGSLRTSCAAHRDLELVGRWWRQRIHPRVGNNCGLVLEVRELPGLGVLQKGGQRLEELNGTLLYLAYSNASGFVSGVTIPVDGGYLIDNI